MSDLGLSAVKAYGGVAQTLGGMAGGKESGGVSGPGFGDLLNTAVGSLSSAGNAAETAVTNAAMGARLMLIEGRVQRSKEGVTHLMGVRVIDRTAELERLSEDHQPIEPPLTRADEVKHPQYPGSMGNQPGMHRHPRNVRVLPKSRDFH